MPSLNPRTKRVLWFSAGVVLLCYVGTLAALYLLKPYAREWVIQKVAERYQSDVELESLTVSIFPSIFAAGEGLIVRHKGRTDVPPLISIRKLSIETDLIGLLRQTKRIRRVTLEGFEVHVPPDRDDDEEDGEETDPGSRDDEGSGRVFVIDEILADGTMLRILPKKEGKQPLEFALKNLRLQSVGLDRPMQFDAVLTNPKPPGEIETTGEFGPWQEDRPESTPVAGEYRFDNADLSVFKGISGILSSVGEYSGVLERIEVQGTTDTPDFAVSVAGNPVHLTTDFKAIVDGTDGDTYLQPVRAMFGETSLVASGAVRGTAGVKGKTVELDVRVEKARLQDLMMLAVKSDPPMVGNVRFQTQFLLPPGEAEVVDRLELNGEFTIDEAHFTGIDVQKKVEELSRRGEGRPQDVDLPPENIVSEMSSLFQLRAGAMRFSNLNFRVPGASVKLEGTFALASEELDFRGHLYTDASISKTIEGWKSFLLKIVEPFFKGEDGGSEVPIKVTGTRSKPDFGVNLKGNNK